MLSKHIEIKVQATQKAFLKTKKMIFCMIFEKILLLLYSIDWPNLIVWLHLLREIIGNMCIAIVC